MKPRCLDCMYDLTGVPPTGGVVRCPECGAPYDPAKAPPHWAYRVRWATVFLGSVGVAAFWGLNQQLFRRGAPGGGLEPLSKMLAGVVPGFVAGMALGAAVVAVATAYAPWRRPGAPPGGWNRKIDDRPSLLLAAMLLSTTFCVLAPCAVFAWS